jgi:hypothetical protein
VDAFGRPNHPLVWLVSEEKIERNFEEERRRLVRFIDAFGRTNHHLLWLVSEEKIERNFFEKIWRSVKEDQRDLWMHMVEQIVLR